MDRVATLILAGEELERRIWASLPLNVRFAELIRRLVFAGTEDDFGRAIYDEFARLKVVGVPDNRAERMTKAKQFGHKAFAVAKSKFHNPEWVKEVMSSFLMRFIVQGGSKGLKPEAGLDSAEGYVITGLIREGLNYAKQQQRRKHREHGMTVYDDEGGEKQMDIPVIHDLEDLAGRFPDQVILKALKEPSLKHDLEKEHPDAPLYVKMVLVDGYHDKKIVGDPKHGVPSMLPHPFNKAGDPLTPQSWDMTYKPKILNVLRKHLQDLFD